MERTMTNFHHFPFPRPAAAAGHPLVPRRLVSLCYCYRRPAPPLGLVEILPLASRDGRVVGAGGGEIVGFADDLSLRPSANKMKL